MGFNNNPRNSTPQCISKRNENVCPQTNLYMNVHHSITYKRQVKTT